MADTLASILAEFNALTPEVEILKRLAGHDGCDGWSLSGDPRVSRCGCGVRLEALADLARGYAQAKREEHTDG